MRASGNKPSPHPGQTRALRAVASFEFSKGIFVLLVGVCALRLVHRDVWLIAESALARLHIDPDRHFAQVFLDFADRVTDSRLWAAAWIAFTYAGLRFAEGYGLWRERVWGEWIAFISGALFLPLEIRQIFRGVTILRSGLFLGNLLVVLFMLYLLRENHRRRVQAAIGATQPETQA